MLTFLARLNSNIFYNLYIFRYFCLEIKLIKILIGVKISFAETLPPGKQQGPPPTPEEIDTCRPNFITVSYFVQQSQSFMVIVSLVTRKLLVGSSKFGGDHEKISAMQFGKNGNGPVVLGL